MPAKALVSIASGHPLIDLDLTFLIQFGLFLVLAFVTNRLLFQPYLALRKRRRDGIEGAREEADRMTAQADARLADYEKQMTLARNRAGEEGRKVRAEASAHEREVTDKARAAAQTSIDAAQATMRAETERARAELLPQAEVLARAISSKLLGREVS